jgi:hypothetical protein
VAELNSADFSVASHCGVLYLRHDDYRYVPGTQFDVHAGGGMSSSIAFTRAFAEQLAADLDQDRVTHYADNVLARTTLPKFQRTLLSPRRSTIYVSHKGSLTSAGWLDDVFGNERVATGETRGAAQGLGPVLYGTLAAGYQDVTQQVIAQCLREGAHGRWAVPEEDWQRGALLGDPVPNQVKHLVLRSLPDEQGRLADRVLRDTDRCTFRYLRGVLSAEIPGPACPA